MHRIYMSGLELIEKIVVQGERDFTGILVQDGFKVEGEEGKALVCYLKEKHKRYEKDPLDFSYASLKNIEARNLFLPWLRAIETDFTGACLMGCQLTYGIFERATFREANLSPALSVSPSGGKTTSFARSELLGVNFEKATLQNVCFDSAYLSKANFTSSYLHSADFTGATLCQVRGLESAIDLEHAIIKDVTATEKERKILMASRSKIMFKKRVDSNIN